MTAKSFRNRSHAHEQGEQKMFLSVLLSSHLSVALGLPESVSPPQRPLSGPALKVGEVARTAKEQPFLLLSFVRRQVRDDCAPE